ncbi:hypothetical protein AKJ16_DCAP24959 [Drosera capensis]
MNSIWLSLKVITAWIAGRRISIAPDMYVQNRSSGFHSSMYFDGVMISCVGISYLARIVSFVVFAGRCCLPKEAWIHGETKSSF